MAIVNSQIPEAGGPTTGQNGTLIGISLLKKELANKLRLISENQLVGHIHCERSDVVIDGTL
jgi:hypothetical protein